MNDLIKYTVVILTLACFSASGPNAQSVPDQDRPKNENLLIADLATDEAVLAELQKRVDAKPDSFGKKGGNKLEARFLCIERLKESEKVIVIGFFAYDRGCRLDGAFVDSRYFESTDAALSKKALAAFGWEKAPKREREMLALYWAKKGLLAFFSVLETKNKELNEIEFHPPRSETVENGEIKVTLWIRLPPGRMPSDNRGPRFRGVEYRFAADGRLLQNLALEK